MKQNYKFTFRWWVVLIPIAIMVAAIFATSNMPRYFEVKTSLFIPAMSETDEQECKPGDIVALLRSKTVLKDVSLTLYARIMINGNAEKDNNFVTAKHYRKLVEITPQEVMALIDKSSEEATVANLLAYEKPDPQNFVYGLFMWDAKTNVYFNHEALLRNLSVEHVPQSNVFNLRYVADDPSIAYHTVAILVEDFIGQGKAKCLADSTDTTAHECDVLSDDKEHNTSFGKVIASTEILDPPVYPLNALPHCRKQIVLGALAGGIVLALLLGLRRRKDDI